MLMENFKKIGIMDKSRFFLLFRVLIISGLYFLINPIIGFGFILDYKVFIPVLCCYLISIIFSIVISEKKSDYIKIGTDIFFVTFFIIKIIWLLYIMKDNTDAPFGILYFYTFFPMLLLFIIWLIQDIKNSKEVLNTRLLLIRFLIIVLFSSYGFMIFVSTYKIYIPALILYLFFIIFCGRFSEIKREKAIIASNCILILYILLLFIWFILFDNSLTSRSFDTIVFCICETLPLFIFLTTWLIGDVINFRKLIKNKS